MYYILIEFGIFAKLQDDKKFTQHISDTCSILKNTLHLNQKTKNSVILRDGNVSRVL